MAGNLKTPTPTTLRCWKSDRDSCYAPDARHFNHSFHNMTICGLFPFQEKEITQKTVKTSMKKKLFSNSSWNQ